MVVCVVSMTVRERERREVSWAARPDQYSSTSSDMEEKRTWPRT